jgi:branched-chain amino acid transport system permease protein
MSEFLSFTILGIVTAAIYAVAASGLVVTYTTSGIFNFAQGAFGMFAAFIYWQLRVEWGWPAPIALAVVLLILAPAFGAAIERVIFRGIEDTTEVIKIVVSVSLLFLVFQFVPIIFPAAGRRIPGFFDPDVVSIGDINVTWHDLITIIAALLVAVVLRAFLFRTRTGVAMRAVVDDRGLAELNGGRPGRASMLAWAMGASLAALAGILLAGSQGSLTIIPLTLLVINAYAAAMIGRLRSLPLTFVGALILGLTESYFVGYLPSDQQIASIFGHELDTPISLAGIRPAIPVVLLFIVLLVLPPTRVRAAGLRKSREHFPIPTYSRWIIGGAALVAGTWLFTQVADGTRINNVAQGMAFAIIMLSLVPLTGYGGQISLANMTLAGVGAVIMGHFGGDGTMFGLLLAIVVPAAIGALIALPALRLTGLYLALATGAFAVFMDRMVFTQSSVMPNGALAVPRLDVPGVSFDSNEAYLVLLSLAFSLVALLVVAVRRGEFGRRLQAMKTSPAACTTLGLDLTMTKLQVFTLSAAIAGLGGALYGGQLTSINPERFQFLSGLPIVLLAVSGGIGAVGGALFGGMAYAAFFFIVPAWFPGLANLLTLGPGFTGIGLGRNPNGAVNEIARSFKEKAGTGEGVSPYARRAALVLFVIAVLDLVYGVYVALVPFNPFTGALLEDPDSSMALVLALVPWALAAFCFGAGARLRSADPRGVPVARVVASVVALFHVGTGIATIGETPLLALANVVLGLALPAAVFALVRRVDVAAEVVEAEPDESLLGIDEPFTAADLARLDHELGLDEEELYAALVRGDSG